MPIPEEIAVAIATLATIVSHYLRDAKLGRWLNALIASITLALCAFLVLWLTNSFASNLRANVGVFLLTVILITAKEGKDLWKYILEAKSPLVPPPEEESIPMPKRRASANQYGQEDQ